MNSTYEYFMKRRYECKTLFFKLTATKRQSCITADI